MTERRSLNLQLPEYRNPPIVEVAASVQFATIPGLDAARLGLLWSRFRKNYPRTEQHPPLPYVAESFESTKRAQVGFSVESLFPAPRLWFLSPDETRLVQVQSNRLVVNWRQLDSPHAYLRYSGLRTMLSDALSSLSIFLNDEGLEGLTPDQAELTYVNHIAAGDLETGRKPLADFVSCWSVESNSIELGAPEETSFRTQYVVKSDAGKPAARLFVELDSAYTRRDGAPIYVMNMIARGAPLAVSIEGALEFFDEAHRWIVNGFTQLTTDFAHKLWERSR